MTERTPLSSSSPEFARLEYFLQLSLKSTTARVLQAFLLSNPHQQVTFDKQANNGMLTLDSWLDCSQFSNGRPEEDMYQRVGGGGVQFHVGRVMMDGIASKSKLSSTGTGIPIKSKDNTAAGHGAKVVRQMLLCRVAVGRAYVCADVSHAAKDAVPSGYNSFQLLSGERREPYGHDYWVKSVQQVLATHLITFEYDPVAERKSREKPRCDNCENTYASVYCAADNANLCSDCDTRLHMANKVSQKHTRTAIGKGVDALGQCRMHPDQRIEFFCSQCHVPVCVHCKMVGHHSTGESARHKLVSVVEAFDTVMKESQMADQVLTSRRTAIHNQAEAINQRARQIEQKQSQLEAELEQIHRQALASLKAQTERKLMVLQGDQMELVRQDQEINELEQFLEYQQTGMDAYPLLFNWSKHLQLRQSLREFKHFRDSIDVHPDLRIAGAISVDVDPAVAPPASKFTALGRAAPFPLKKQQATYNLTDQRASTATENINIRRSAPVRRTSAFFAETLSALDDLDMERSSYVNRLMDDERSMNAGGSEC